MIVQPRDKFFTSLMAIRSAASDPQTSSGVEIVCAGKTLDAAGMEALRRGLTAGAQRGRWSFVIDLGRVKSLDSPGLGMLVSALRTIRDIGGSVGLVTASPSLQRILEVCTHNRRCKIFSSTSDAVESLTLAAQPKSAA